MSSIRVALSAALLTAAIAATAHAQTTTTPPPAAKPATTTSTTTTTTTTSTAPSATDEAKAWTRKKYLAARVGWMKDKAKWTACRAENKEKKLRGRASWQFLYNCMKG